MRLLASLRARTAAQDSDPRRPFEPLLREAFTALDPAVVDRFFANFGYAMPLSLVHQLVGLVRERRPRLAVEVGSGVSTLALSGALAEHAGFLVSVESEPRYAYETAEALTRRDRVALVCAAGAPELLQLAAGWRPGLVVVDGPAGGGRFERDWLALYRALLSSDCVCAVDDTDRSDNDEAAAALAREHRLEKLDFGDPMLPRHRYSLLLPAGVAPPPSPAVPLP